MKRIFRNVSSVLLLLIMLADSAHISAASPEACTTESHDNATVRVNVIETGQVIADQKKLNDRLNEIELLWEPVSAKTAAEHVVAIKREVAKYPTKIWHGLLDTIFVFGDLKYRDRSVDGSYGAGFIIVSIASKSHANIARAVHHELSSILLGRYRSFFQEAEFLKCNPEGFSYNSELRSATDTDPTLDERWVSSGFVGSYGTTDIENDFNLISEQLFIPDSQFWRAYKTHQRFRKKVGIIIAFYHKISPRFSISFFQKQPRIQSGIDPMMYVQPESLR